MMSAIIVSREKFPGISSGGVESMIFAAMVCAAASSSSTVSGSIPMLAPCSLTIEAAYEL